MLAYLCICTVYLSYLKLRSTTYVFFVLIKGIRALALVI